MLSLTKKYPQLLQTSDTITNSFISHIFSNYSIEGIVGKLNELKKMKVLVIGDVIIDQYNYVIPKGRAIKDPILSCDYVKNEIYAGGILAIANHLSEFVSQISLLTIVGDLESNLSFIKSSLKKNIDLQYFTKKNSFTTMKKRYINIQRNEKLFKIEKINDAPLSKKLTNIIIQYLSSNIKNYDIVLVGDFGHGFINKEIASYLQSNSAYLALNVQTNSANLGFNYVTKYNHCDFISMDYRELQYAVQDQHSDKEVLLKKIREITNFNKILLTMGKNGVVYSESKNTNFFAPTFKTNVKDTVGAGDAVFSLASLLAFINTKNDLLTFCCNCVGALAVQYQGNKENISKKSLISFMNNLQLIVKPLQN